MNKEKIWFKKQSIPVKIGVALLASPFYFAYRGFIGYKLYGWLILPMFPSMPTLNIFQVAALCFVIPWFMPSVKSINIKEEFLDKDENLETAIWVIKPLFVLLFGYLLHLIIV